MTAPENENGAPGKAPTLEKHELPNRDMGANVRQADSIHVTFVEGTDGGKAETNNSTANRGEIPWGDLAKLLSEHQVVATKGSRAFIFARFVEGACKRLADTGSCTAACPGVDHRVDHNVIEVTALGLDFDHGTTDQINEVLLRLHSLGWQHVWYTTYSSTPAEPRIRIVVSLSHPVVAADWKRFWDAVIDLIGAREIIDTACRTVGHLFFCPECAPGSTPRSYAAGSIPIDVDHVLASAKPREDEPVREPGAGIEAWGQSVAQLSSEQTAQLRETLKSFVRSAASEPGQTFKAARTIFHDYGLSVADGRPYFAAWNAGNEQQHTTAELERQIERVASKITGLRGGAVLHTYGEQLQSALQPKLLPVSVPVRVSKRASAFVDRIHEDAALPVVHLPFKRLDDHLGGLELHNLTTFTASSGKGKTSMAVQVAGSHSEHAPAIYYVGEMTEEIVVSRLVGQRMGMPWRDVMRGRVSKADMHRILEPLKLYMVHRSQDPIGAMRRAYDEVLADGHTEIAMLVVDYIQLLADLTGKSDMRIATVKAIDGVKAFVLDAPIVCTLISQASRPGADVLRKGVENAEDAMSAGAETAQLENASTNMLQVSYASVDGVTEHDVQLLVAKSRYGGGIRFPFKYNGRTGVWTEATVLVPNAEQSELTRQILLHVDVHAARKCKGPDGLHHCGTQLTQQALYAGTAKSPGTHRVGAQKVVVPALKKLLDAKVLYQDGFELKRIPVGIGR